MQIHRVTRLNDDMVESEVASKPVTTSRSRHAKRLRTESEQLEELLGYPWPFPGRPPKHDLTTWTVTDDWPDPGPVIGTELEVFERWFGDLFDELFDPDAGAEIDLENSTTK